MAVDDLSNLKRLPFVGTLVGPYVDSARNVISTVNEESDNSLSNVVNSVMPCTFNGAIPTCTGTLDRDSVRKLIKKLLDFIPFDKLTPGLAPTINLLKDML